MHGISRRLSVLLTCGVLVLWPVAALAQYGAANGEWRSYGGDLGSTKYSPLEQIDFDRITGEPVWPIEERPVETDTDLAGDVLSPTQPFPTKPPAFEYQGVTVDDLVDFTPEIRALAVEAVQDFRLGPLFTPPMLSEDGGLQGTIQRPHVGGGAGWAGSAVDP